MPVSTKEIARNEVPVLLVLISFIVLLPEVLLAPESPWQWAGSCPRTFSSTVQRGREGLPKLLRDVSDQQHLWLNPSLEPSSPATSVTFMESLYLKLWQPSEMNLCGWIFIYTAHPWTCPLKWSLEQSRLRSREAPSIWHNRNYFASLFWNRFSSFWWCCNMWLVTDIFEESPLTCQRLILLW